MTPLHNLKHFRLCKGVDANVISPLVGEMPDRAEGGEHHRCLVRGSPFDKLRKLTMRGLGGCKANRQQLLIIKVTDHQSCRT
ncbi:hypothetical protein FHW17_001924 [Phyllobacterium sp. P30BS-XVII]|nr:hypothetical protein [Phyllobacterium sp. P30BS-XVII]